MKRLLIFLTLLFLTADGFSQMYTRQKAEKASTFITRVTGLKEFVHPVIEAKGHDTTNKAIIYFAPAKNETTVGYILITENGTAYRPMIIDTFYEEGAPAKIEAVFFANADKDKEQEIIILTSWEQVHADVRGMLYGTFIYDWPTLSRSQKRLTLLKTLSKKLSGGFDGTTEGLKVKAKYTSVASIRKRLKELGY